MASATVESPRMFESNFLDFFSRISWWMVPIVWVPIVLATLVVSASVGVSPGVMALQVVAGFAFWTLMEYWLHRTLFHWIPPTTWGPKFHFMLHGVHHKWFQDKLRLVMPPMAAMALGVLFMATFQLSALGFAGVLDPSWAWGAFAGLVVGYINYDLTHYYIHHGRPSVAYYKNLRAHHNAHHHNPKYKELKFGVSMTFWDYVFRTHA